MLTCVGIGTLESFGYVALLIDTEVILAGLQEEGNGVKILFCYSGTSGLSGL